MKEEDLRKGGVYIWRKGDPQHETTLRVTQITRRMVRAKGLTGSKANPHSKGQTFWNPKSFILDECTPDSAKASDV